MEINEENEKKIRNSIEGIKTILTQFIREEYGNRMSQFSLQALNAAICKETDTISGIIDGVNKEQPCHNIQPEQ